MSGLLGQGLALHQAGRLAEAEPYYRRCLAFSPDDPEALHLLGVLAHQRGRQAEAVDLLRRATQRAPQAAAYHNSLGNVLRAGGDAAGAVACYRRAVQGAPNEPSFLHHLGLALHEAGEAGAEAPLRRAIRLAPDLIAARLDLGHVLIAAGRAREAETCIAAALRRAPTHAAARNALGLALSAQGRHADALAAFEAAMAADPGNPNPPANRAAALLALDRLEAAAAAYAALPADAATSLARAQIHLRLQQGGAAEALARGAVALAPDNPDAQQALGQALSMQDRPEAALVPLSDAARLAPERADLAHDMGLALRDGARWRDALPAFRRAAALAPDSAEYRANLAYALLANGDFAEGLVEFEWRTRKPGNVRLAAPRWDGSPTRETVLIHAEQGLGDTLQFCRFVRDAAVRAPVVFAGPRALKSLLVGFAGDVPICDADPLPEHARQVPLMSLPFLLALPPADWARRVPYVRAPADAAARWRDALAALPRPRIGFVWSGNPAYPADRRRSMPLAALAPLIAGRRVGWVSLQVGEARAALAAAALPAFDAGAAFADFADTAGAVANLDLVLAVDTAVAHLAGAMGVPVWLLNRADTDWRWLLERSDSPWYPTMRIFRQAAPGDWASVTGAVGRALADGFAC